MILCSHQCFAKVKTPNSLLCRKSFHKTINKYSYRLYNKRFYVYILETMMALTPYLTLNNNKKSVYSGFRKLIHEELTFMTNIYIQGDHRENYKYGSKDQDLNII